MELVNYRDSEFNICHFQGRSFYAYTYIISRLEDRELSKPKGIDIITFFNNKDNAILAKQLERNDIPYINGFNSFDKKWDNRDKISYTLSALEKCASKIVIICDASDVLINTFDNIIEKFKKSKRKILFNATTNNYPDVLIDKVMGRDFMGKFRYFNAGCCIGYKEDLINFYSECKKFLDTKPYNPWGSEQFILRNIFAKYLENNNNDTVGFDNTCDIFQSFANTRIEKDGEQFRIL
jgi:GH15 family glucan-1,4-alpha-glucosidase